MGRYIWEKIMLKNEILKNAGMINEEDTYLFFESLSNEDLQVIEEGLRVFKKSKQLRRYADKLERSMARKADRGKAESAKVLKDLISRIRSLADKFDKIEQSFARKEITRAEAKSKIKELKLENQELMNKLKSFNVKRALKIFGISAVGAALVPVLVSLGNALINMTAVKSIITGSDFSKI
jgi:hypothetical protein